MKSLQDTFKLSNGVEIPCVGFGTFRTPDGEVAVRAVKEAIAAGYRHIDTAAVYGNERSVGAAVRESGIDRKDIFITSKLWNSDQGFDSTLRAFDKTMQALGTDYLDLYLIHWPIAKGHDGDWDKMNRETWRAMERLCLEGRIRSIGVSNFKVRHLTRLIEQADIVPMVNQIELHPGLNQDETVSYCKEAAYPRRSVGAARTGQNLRQRRNAGDRRPLRQKHRTDRAALDPSAGHPAAAQVGHPGTDRLERGAVRFLAESRRHETHRPNPVRRIGLRSRYVPDVAA